jgi:hypothetical protein
MRVKKARMRSILYAFVSLTLSGCGGQAKDAAAPGSPGAAGSKGPEPADGAEAAAEAVEAEPVSRGGLPKECAKSGEPCVPPGKFVSVLCNGTYAEVTLHLFHQESPFTRGYLRGKTKAWNASGGASENDAMLDFDEEVVLLRERSAPQGMQVSGVTGGYDALRWDGSCVTLSNEEVTLDRPPSPKAAKIEWRYLGSQMQEALRKDEAINETYRARRKECKGVTTGTVSAKCVKLDDKLSEVVVDFVRGGGSLSEPEKMPEW